VRLQNATDRCLHWLSVVAMLCFAVRAELNAVSLSAYPSLVPAEHHWTAGQLTGFARRLVALDSTVPIAFAERLGKLQTPWFIALAVTMALVASALYAAFGVLSSVTCKEIGDGTKHRTSLASEPGEPTP
jgi:hypothetical protein